MSAKNKYELLKEIEEMLGYKCKNINNEEEVEKFIKKHLKELNIYLEDLVCWY